MAVVPYSTSDLSPRQGAIQISARVQFAEGDARIAIM